MKPQRYVCCLKDAFQVCYDDQNHFCFLNVRTRRAFPSMSSVSAIVVLQLDFFGQTFYFFFFISKHKCSTELDQDFEVTTPEPELRGPLTTLNQSVGLFRIVVHQKDPFMSKLSGWCPEMSPGWCHLFSEHIMMVSPPCFTAGCWMCSQIFFLQR